jgi:predicted GNAT family N-acyltransferase
MIKKISDMNHPVKAFLITNEADLKAAYALRKEVFVVEQQVSLADEFDEFEEVSHHFIAKQGDATVGAARWRVTDHGVKLERFAVGMSYRGQGVGKALVQAVLDHIYQVRTEGKLYLHAQLEAIPLYAYFGFEIVGEQFAECGIEHRTMELVR